MRPLRALLALALVFALVLPAVAKGKAKRKKKAEDEYAESRYRSKAETGATYRFSTPESSKYRIGSEESDPDLQVRPKKRKKAKKVVEDESESRYISKTEDDTVHHYRYSEDGTPLDVPAKKTKGKKAQQTGAPAAPDGGGPPPAALAGGGGAGAKPKLQLKEGGMKGGIKGGFAGPGFAGGGGMGGGMKPRGAGKLQAMPAIGGQGGGQPPGGMPPGAPPGMPAPGGEGAAPGQQAQ